MRIVRRVAGLVIVAVITVFVSGGAASANEHRGLTNPLLPDRSAVTDRLMHWPLGASEHPDLAPRYPIAKELAEPGIDWLTLCERGAQNRVVARLKDQTAYLHAWCAITRRDSEAALTELRPLLSSSVRNLPSCVRVDMANILAAEGSADAARRLLAKIGITDLAILDRLAALFLDMNQRDDALEIMDLAIGSRAPSTPKETCFRQAKRMVIGAQDLAHLDVPTRYFTVRTADPTCVALEAELACSRDSDCGDYFRLLKKARVGLIYDAYTVFQTKPYEGIAAMRKVGKGASKPEERAAVSDVALAMFRTNCRYRGATYAMLAELGLESDPEVNALGFHCERD